MAGNLLKDASGRVIQDASAVNLFAHYATRQKLTAIKTTGGILVAVIVNTGGGLDSVTTLYDSNGEESDIIAVIDSRNMTGVFNYNCKTDTGITISTTGIEAPDVTVIYR